jgi:putative MATE family efflux protein
MGVAGAALATILTQGLSAVVGVWVLTKGRYGIHLRLRHLPPDFPLIRKIMALGIPSSLEQSARGMGFAVMMLLVTGFGTTITAAYGIGVRILGFIIIPALGLSMATTTVVGQNIGAGRPERAVKTGWIGAGVAALAMTAGGVVLFLFGPSVVAAFVPEAPEVIRIGGHFLRIISLFFGFIGIQQVLTGALRGAGATGAALVLTVVQLWVFLFPTAWLLSQRTHLGPDGIWWAYPVSNVLGAVLAVGWFWKGRWQRGSLAGATDMEERVAREAIVEEGLGS